MKTVQTTTEAFQVQQKTSEDWAGARSFEGELAQHRANDFVEYQTRALPGAHFRVVRVTTVHTVTTDESLSITREVLQ